MTIPTHLILISDQLIPNLTPILDDALKPQKVVMLVSDDKAARAGAMIEILSPRGIKTEQHRVPDPWDIAGIRDQIIDILDAYRPGDIALNATGGTKPMAIAAYDVFRSFDHPVFYVQGRLLWLHPRQPPHPLAQNLKLKDYLLAYGADSVHIPPARGVLPAIRGLTAALLAGIGRYAGELGALNALALKADNPQLAADIDGGPQNRPMLWDLLELFQRAGLCRLSGNRLYFPDQSARFFANGGWLEQHVYGICLNLKKALDIQEVAGNVVIHRRPFGKTPVKNEIDVCLLKANRLHLIECKTQRLDKEANTLYKLDSLRDLMGGLQGRALLVSFNRLDKASRARARELNIALCCNTDLPHLQQHLQTWLTAGS